MDRIIVKRIIEKLDIKLGRHTPLIQQSEFAECGLACLAMICRHYGKNVDLMSLRHQFNLSARGSSLSVLAQIAEQLGLATRPLSLDIDELSALRTPCVLHWEFNHFVVLIKVQGQQVTLHDPATGRRKMTLETLSQSFTGVALEAWPDSTFSAEALRHQFSTSKLIRGVYGIKRALGKIFFLSLVLETINLLLPIATQLVMDHAIPASDSGLLTLICCGLMIFILLQAAVSMLRGWSSLVLATLINVQWQAKLFKHLLRLPLDYFERRRLGDIQSRFGSLDVLRSTFTASIVGAMMDSIMVISVLIMMSLYGGWLTWIVVGFTAIYVLMRIATYGYYRELSEESLIKSARASSYFMETLYGIATVKMQGMTTRRGNHWLNLEIDNINTGIRVSKIDMLFGGIYTFIAACDQIVILWIGGHLVIGNQMTLGMFVAFGAFRSQFSERVNSLTTFLLQLRMTSLHNERIADIALHPSENRQPEVAAPLAFKPVAIATQDLCYRYDNHAPLTFRDLNISVDHGECVAIVGASGSGKTTLMKLLCGLFTPVSGKIEVNGIDIQQLGLNNYQSMIACVMQDDKLFAGSIKQNISGFVDEIDEAWMQECAQMSFIHQVIMALPMGYETLIGELGEGLSGGQKQRLFIARALYKKPGLLFMDEATSALDVESEERVNEAVKQLAITRVIISHRESTLATADRIIVLEDSHVSVGAD